MTTYQVFGHRGAPHEALENSLEGFQIAITMGCDAIEFDLHHSADYKIVCHHDPSLDGIRVVDLSAAELKRRFDIPTLSEILALNRGSVGLMVELKRDHSNLPVLVDETLICLREENDPSMGPVWVGSLSPEINGLLRAAECEYPLFGGAINRHDLEIQRTMQPAVLSMKHTFATPSLVSELVEEGYELWCWTVNELEEAERLAELGVHAIITDHPRLMLEKQGRNATA